MKHKQNRTQKNVSMAVLQWHVQIRGPSPSAHFPIKPSVFSPLFLPFLYISFKASNQLEDAIDISFYCNSEETAFMVKRTGKGQLEKKNQKPLFVLNA